MGPGPSLPTCRLWYFGRPTGSPWAWFLHWQMVTSRPPSHRLFWEAVQIQGSVLIKSNGIITRKAVTEPSAGSQTVNGIWIELALVLKVSEHFYHHKVIYKHQKWICLFQKWKTKVHRNVIIPPYSLLSPQHAPPCLAYNRPTINMY